MTDSLCDNQVELSSSVQIENTSDALRITVTRRNKTYFAALAFLIVWTVLSYVLVLSGILTGTLAWFLLIATPFLTIFVALTLLLTRYCCELSKDGLRCSYRNIIFAGTKEYPLDDINGFEEMTDHGNRSEPEYKVAVIIKDKRLTMYDSLPTYWDMRWIAFILNSVFSSLVVSKHFKLERPKFLDFPLSLDVNALLKIVKEMDRENWRHGEQNEKCPIFELPATFQDLLYRCQQLEFRTCTKNTRYETCEISEDELLLKILEFEYDGLNRQQVRDEMIRFVQIAIPPFLGTLLCCFSASLDSLKLKIIVLARVMKIVQWDGLKKMDDVPMFLKPEYRSLYWNVGEDLLMDSQHMPQQYINQLDELLRVGDKYVVIATLVYLRAWLLSGGEKNLSLIRIRSCLPDLLKSPEALIQSNTEKFIQTLKHLEEET